jgi:hypothetical protein
MERSVDVGTLALAVITADDDEVEGVADALEVVLLELRVATEREKRRGRGKSAAGREGVRRDEEEKVGRKDAPSTNEYSSY